MLESPDYFFRVREIGRLRQTTAGGGGGGGWVTKLYICALLIIDGLGYASGPRRCRFLDPERRLFSEIATSFF